MGLVFIHLGLPKDTRVIYCVWQLVGLLGNCLYRDSISKVSFSSIGFSHELYFALIHSIIGEPSECHIGAWVAVDIYHHVVWCLIRLERIDLSLQVSNVSIGRVTTSCLLSDKHLDVWRNGVVLCLVCISLDNQWVVNLLFDYERCGSSKSTIFGSRSNGSRTRLESNNCTVIQLSQCRISYGPSDIAVGCSSR